MSRRTDLRLRSWRGSDLFNGSSEQDNPVDVPRWERERCSALRATSDQQIRHPSQKPQTRSAGQVVGPPGTLLPRATFSVDLHQHFAKSGSFGSPSAPSRGQAGGTSRPCPCEGEHKQTHTCGKKRSQRDPKYVFSPISPPFSSAPLPPLPRLSSHSPLCRTLQGNTSGLTSVAAPFQPNSTCAESPEADRHPDRGYSGRRRPPGKIQIQSVIGKPN